MKEYEHYNSSLKRVKSELKKQMTELSVSRQELKKQCRSAEELANKSSRSRQTN